MHVICIFTRKKILMVQMKSEREMNKKEMFSSALRPFKLMLAKIDRHRFHSTDFQGI